MKKNSFRIEHAIILVLVLVIAALGVALGRARGQSNAYAQGMQAMAASKPDEAIRLFDKAIAQNPDDPVAQFGLGWARHLKGELDPALESYKKAVSAGIDAMQRSYFNMGVILQGRKATNEAQMAYQSAITLNPRATGAIYNLAFVYLDLNKPREALEHFKRAQALDPRNPSIALNVGLVQERLGSKGEAVKSFKEALALDPNLQLAKDKLKALGAS
jgi:tetratricopeptide (TPR) repeat protein